MSQLILIGGYPGTGKTYLSKKIQQRFPVFQMLSVDDIKEENWDSFGFNNLKEKEILNKKSIDDYYEKMEKHFQQKDYVISDYPFSAKQKDRLEYLVQHYNYQVMTIRLVADLDVLYARQKKRDLEDSRHPGHLLTAYHRGEVLSEDLRKNNVLEYNEFIERCKTRGYDRFSLGYLYEMNVSDFADIDYEALFSVISECIQKRK
ncbi:AAA family ATPase [Oceanobacillus neutriphilus]|uniref:Kinase n=1 Tax=Oceanobacillus neutriphilus TaxID=531815 RepID=A0ABQ2NUX3_9BACI|nr:AAA family ATPase [Oceanobacillus neutriphilus]GGP11077.1 kinase [Oceanobacillus neutriphilus]